MSASSQPAPSCLSSPPFLSCLPHVLSLLVLSCPSSTALLPPSLPRPHCPGCGHLQLHHPAPARSAAVNYSALTCTCEKGDQPQGFDQHMREWQESPAARRSALARRATASACEKDTVVATTPRSVLARKAPTRPPGCPKLTPTAFWSPASVLISTRDKAERVPRGPTQPKMASSPCVRPSATSGRGGSKAGP